MNSGLLQDRWIDLRDTRLQGLFYRLKWLSYYWKLFSEGQNEKPHHRPNVKDTNTSHQPNPSSSMYNILNILEYVAVGESGFYVILCVTG
jgi:hypothetical protein